MSVYKALKQERQLADAIASVFADDHPIVQNQIDELVSGVRVEQNSLVLARAVFAKLGVRTAYDAVVDNAFEDARIALLLQEQPWGAAEAVKKLRAEFAGLPVDGLKALRLLIDSAIREKEVD